jgi:flagellar hook assembly protein FlgD
LGNPVPNPFNPMTRIHYYVPDESVVTLEIFDTSGRLVVRLVDNERMPRGMHAVEWRGVDGHGRAVGSGVYYYRLKIGAETISKKMVLLR